MARLLSNKNNLEILFEDNHLLIVNKRSGDIVQGDITRDTPLSEIAKSYIKEKYNKPGNVYIGVVHRLDRPTSGVIIFAKTSKALTRMNAQFRDKIVKKKYWAITNNCPKDTEGTLRHFLKKDNNKNSSRAYHKKVKDSKEAILDYNVLSIHNKMALVELKPLTGRHHQIRVQLSSIGAVIVGDMRYGFKEQVKDKRLYLHAKTIEFVHPTKKEKIVVSAPVPDDNLWNKVAID